jgi:3-hydroxyacyl-[acyl-carrier-protein] dehydratase
MVSAKIMHEGSGFALTEAEVKVDGKTVCNADITFRVVDFPKGEFLASMHEVARRIAFPMETVVNG